ncbi:VOC family protein [Actinopolymorpha pittospori]|uniref:VOC family protein n=1 Tax=Actinopolymorpha pittospori TaxID=648752 RepID=UPI003CD0BFE8
MGILSRSLTVTFDASGPACSAGRSSRTPVAAPARRRHPAQPPVRPELLGTGGGEPRAPDQPSPADQQHTVATALKLGGDHFDVGQRPEEKHVVLADPEGNEFCVKGN